MPIKNFNDLVKGKRPGSIVNKSIINSSSTDIIDGLYIQVSSDMWTFFKAWYGADFKIEVSLSDSSNLTSHRKLPVSDQKNQLQREELKDSSNQKRMNSI